jgi:hypothetical protein
MWKRNNEGGSIACNNKKVLEKYDASSIDYPDVTAVLFHHLLGRGLLMMNKSMYMSWTEFVLIQRAHIWLDHKVATSSRTQRSLYLIHGKNSLLMLY